MICTVFTTVGSDLSNSHSPCKQQFLSHKHTDDINITECLKSAVCSEKPFRNNK